jgi:outer membrane biosynthesis protein TonB
MASRTPRRSFATPFVVTLVAVPACYVQSAPPPSTGPQPPPAQTAEPAQPPPPATQPTDPQTPPTRPPVIVNPPRPTPTPQPAPTPPPQPQPQPTPPPQPTQTAQQQWTVFKGKDGCLAAIKVECQPNATCNPPPPFKYACPEKLSVDKPITLTSSDGGATCFYYAPMPACPKGAMCNPPPPRQLACPKR